MMTMTGSTAINAIMIHSRGVGILRLERLHEEHDALINEHEELVAESIVLNF